jgi:DNA polymerase/3'-5' exonuclease PolX
MSSGKRMPHAEALAIAERLVKDLKRVCNRVKVAGSLRRKAEDVGDIEIVCEPNPQSEDLFGEVLPDIEPVRILAASWGEVVKGGDRFIQVALPEGINVDLWLVHPPADWFVILAIRTGPAMLSQWAVTLMRNRGYRCTEGHIEAGGKPVQLESEEAFFRCAGLPCLAPRLRGTAEATKPIEP